MTIGSRKLLTLCGLAGVLALSSCATTQETIQQCRQNAYTFCNETAGAKDTSAGGSGAVDAAARNAAYQQCLNTQLEACSAP